MITHVNKLGVDRMFNFESKQPGGKILRIDLSKVTLSDGQSFQVVESTTEIYERINLNTNFIKLYEFENVDHIKPLLIRTSLINTAESDYASYVCNDEEKLHEMVDKYNQTIKLHGTKRGAINYK